MAISWTLIVLGALLQGMQCNADNSTTAATTGTTQNISNTTDPMQQKNTPSISLSSTATTLNSSTSVTPSNETVPTSVQIKMEPTETSIPSSSTDSNKSTAPPITFSTLNVTQQTSSVTSTPTTQNGASTTQVTTNKPETQNTAVTSTGPNNSTQSSPTTASSTNSEQSTTNLNTTAATTSTEASTTQILSTQTTPSPSNLTKNSTSPITEAPKDSKSTASQNPGTTKAQTTASTVGIRNSTPTTQKKEHIQREVCKTLGQSMKGNCMATVTIDDKTLMVTATIQADQEISTESYKPDRGDAENGTTTPGTKHGTESENKGTIPDTLIAIMASCGALVLILCCFAAYCTYHRRSYRKNQQHLTEELQTVENGYHDNPTLEVMEVQPEMQEKKLTMNGEFNDSWIVPIDNLLKEDIPDEEDTHL